MKNTKTLWTLFLLALCACKSPTENAVKYESEDLKIKHLTQNTFIHISYLNTNDFGKVPCNGMVVINKGEAIVFDTPSDDVASSELIKWIQTEKKAKIKAVIATHFHIDCLGGLQAFHDNEIPSYANSLTVELAKSINEIIPQNVFAGYLELEVGGKKVISDFLGEGHTKDNVIGYFPDERVLFGGCLIKSNGAGKGNLNDANINDWPKTVKKIKAKYNEVETIIPGHGKPEDAKLLDYTIELFTN
ncbi:subclass B1 metallo-beta-lactamase [Fulvivirgaceae bacterium BMA10]|uniref:beta-lactamase n=1 Tax=Splendidivirga corallicola TaxID=3051826 RepID=A0ABT8KPS5_9BACT|nr:subclass B1 metallo-beta-lactamase [Fulvivirgaceae bacterium BMA10]